MKNNSSKVEEKSSIIYRDGRVVKASAQLAYAMWLAGGVAIRVAGDNRPLVPWEFGGRG